MVDASSCPDGQSQCGGDCSAQFHMCRCLSPSVSCFGGSCGPGAAGEECETLPDHLENIVTGSHPSLGEAGRSLLRNLLHRYEHVFPAPGEPVMGRTTSVQYEILRPTGPMWTSLTGSGWSPYRTDFC